MREDERTRAWDDPPQRPDRADDVRVARRGVASFDDDLPGLGESLRRFTRRHGWRAYALPVLVVVTIVALLTTRDDSAKHQAGSGSSASGPGTSASGGGPTAPPTASGSISLKSDRAGGNVINTPVQADTLPQGAPYTKAGTGTFSVIPGTTKKFGTGGQLFRYDIEIENGITGIDDKQFADLVDATLQDPRSWAAHTWNGKHITLQRVDSGPVDFHVSMVSVMTVRQLCGYTIPVETSCYVPAGPTSDVNRVVFDDARWVRGDSTYAGDLLAYRQYMINHEDGHAIGHEHAHECLSNGLAPTMMQQTFGLKSAATGKLCQANPWPYPAGATDAPGAEQPDTNANNEYSINPPNS